MTNEEKILKLEAENLSLRDLIQDIFRKFHMKKDLINDILDGRAEGVRLVVTGEQQPNFKE